MTHTPTPAEIETLRNYAKNHQVWCTSDSATPNECGCGSLQVRAILDRLSPPAPEVDEATVWTRSVFDVLYPMIRIEPGFKSGTPLERVRAVIAELIASKDGEIEKLTGERDRQYDENVNRIAAEGAAIVRAEKAQSELAALRAENERLKCLSDGLRTYMYDKDASRREWVVKKYKAAERNTAEPVLPPDAYGRIHTDGSRSGGQPVDTAPVVEVTQADRDAATALYRHEIGIEDGWFSRGLEAGAHDQCVWVQAFTKIRTEAEARGRRQALEEAFKRLNGSHTPLDELKRMMTGGR